MTARAARREAEETMAKTKEEGPRSFATFLAMLAEGRASAQMSEELHALVKSLRDESIAQDTNVKGELTLKLKFVASPRGVVGVGFDVKTKTPPKRTATGHMFITEGGNLSPQDERQPQLPGLREVPRANDELRDVHDVAEEE